MRTPHFEKHRTDRIGWLRAAVLGANDGIVSTASLIVGVALPLLTVLVASPAALIPIVVACSIVFLALLGGFGAYAGGAPVAKAAFRVTFWGALAMALTAGVGALFGATV